MIHDPVIYEINNIKELSFEKTSRILLLGSKLKIMQYFRSKFKNLRPRLIFLDLSLYYQDFKRIERIFKTLQDTECPQISEINGNFWKKVERIFEDCKLTLCDDGYIAVKVNGTIKSDVKSKLDIIFGHDQFVNEIIIDSPFKLWYAPNSTVFERTNYIMLYSQNLNQRIKPVLNEKVSGGYWHSFVSKGQGKAKRFKFRDGKEIILTPPLGTHWKLKQKTILELCEKGEIRLNKKGNPEYWVPLKKGQIIDSNWLDIQSYEWNHDQNVINSSDLYNRLFSMCLDGGDLYLDLSTNFGTSLVVASRLQLKWIGLEENKYKFKLIMKNLIEKGIYFCVYDCESLPDSLNNIKYSYHEKDLSTSVDDSHSLEKLSLQLIERYNIQNLNFNLELIGNWSNKLILGDSYDVLRLLKPNFQKKVKVIYIDPPFFTGTNENIVIPIGLSQPLGVNKSDIHLSVEDLAYNNVLDVSNPIKFFMQWFKKRIELMKSLLCDDGFIFVRFDYHFGHYARMILDEVFGRQNFIIEFLVRRMKKNLSERQAFKQTHLIVHSDSLLVYQNSEEADLNPSIVKKIRRKNQDFAESQYSNDNIWLDIAGYEKHKKTLYPTENSEILLSRIIQISSKKGDLIADFFCGSGTTAAVAEKLGRKWIAGDISRYSIHETKKRILKMPKSASFDHFELSGSQTSTSVNQGLQSEFSIDDESLPTDVPVPKVELKININRNQITINIVQFIPSNSLNSSIRHNYIDFIDFWAVDWDCQDKIFMPQWYSYREMRGKKVVKNIQASATHEYSNPGKYLLGISLVDVFGNRTKQSMTIDIQ
ncbi:MAG: DNA methyltransferase [Promethearchaeota archaeon]